MPLATEAISRIGSTDPAAMLFDAAAAFEEGDPRADEVCALPCFALACRGPSSLALSCLASPCRGAFRMCSSVSDAAGLRERRRRRRERRYGGVGEEWGKVEKRGRERGGGEAGVG